MRKPLSGLIFALGLIIGSFGLLGGIASADPGSTGSTSSSTCPNYGSNCTTPATVITSSGSGGPNDPCLTPSGQLVAPSTNPLCNVATTGSTQAASSTAAATTSPSTSAATGGLAFTGADVVGTIALGLVLIGGGLVIVRVSRRRSQA